MPFAILKNEQTIDELATRLFSADGKLSKTVAEQATAALLKANPQLKKISIVPAGSLLVIPDTAPPVIPSELVEGPTPAFAAAVGRAQKVLRALADRFVAIDARARDAAQSLAELGRKKDIQFDTAHTRPDLARLLRFPLKPLQTIAKDVEAAIKARNDTFANLKNQLESLVHATSEKR